MYAAELIEPGSESYMLATVCSTIANEFSYLVSLLTQTKLKPSQLQTAADYLPKLVDPKTQKKQDGDWVEAFKARTGHPG